MELQINFFLETVPGEILSQKGFLQLEKFTKDSKVARGDLKEWKVSFGCH